MRSLRYFGLAALILRAGAAQIPLRASAPAAAHNESWDLDVGPDPDATDHLVFDTFNSVLQHWTHTRYRNGHAIIPGTVPPGTLLYHGRSDHAMPTTPEWTATDPEHSYLFCRGACWFLTLAAARPLRVLYFDGSSAAKMSNGSMDTQDLLMWGPDAGGSGGRVRRERERLDRLCAWGQPLGVDGFVRMEMDFEIMLCDFTAGVEVVSFLNLAEPHNRLPGHPLPPPGIPPPGNDTDAYGDAHDVAAAMQPHSTSVRLFEVINAGSWHNAYPGETRVRLDLARAVTFYDTSLAPSLVVARRGQERWQHRVYGIVPAELAAAKSRVEAALVDPPASSGVDWAALLRVVVERYADRLELLRYLLEADTPALADPRARADQAMTQLYIMLTPYLLASAVPPNATAPPQGGAHELAWAQPVFAQCASAHTAWLARGGARLAPGEALVLRAVRGTVREICRAVVRMGAAGLAAGLTQEPAPPPDAPVEKLLAEWRAELGALMAWLDWSVWVKCTPACGFEEICYLPTWPFFSPTRRRGPPSRFPDSEEGWEKPQPECIRRIQPYKWVD